jgi:hypothetical protein
VFRHFLFRNSETKIRVWCECSVCISVFKKEVMQRMVSTSFVEEL